MRGDRISNGWLARVLSFWPTRNVAPFLSSLIPPLSTGAFLIFLLSTHSCVLLAQLFFQVLILFGEAFHHYCEGLDLPFQSGGSWFVTLVVVVVAIERVSTMQPFCTRGNNVAYTITMPFLTNDAN